MSLLCRHYRAKPPPQRCCRCHRQTAATANTLPLPATIAMILASFFITTGKKKILVVCLAGARSLLRQKKRSSSRLSSGLCCCVSFWFWREIGSFVVLAGKFYYDRKKSSSRLSGGLCCCVSFWFWREIGFGCTYYYVFGVPYSCGVVLVFLVLAGNSFWCYVRT